MSWKFKYYDVNKLDNIKSGSVKKIKHSSDSLIREQYNKMKIDTNNDEDY